MARTKIELPTSEQVSLFFETYIPEPLASSLADMVQNIINIQSVAVDTGDNNEDERPARGRGRGRAAEVNENDDDVPAPRGRGRAAPAASNDLLDDDDLTANDDTVNDDEPAPRGRGRGRAAEVDQDNDDAPAPRRGRAAVADANDDDDAPPARRRGPAASHDENDDDVPAPRGRGGRAAPEPEPEPEANEDAPITFEDFGGDEATVEEYTNTFMEGYKAKDIKADITKNFDITLKGTDLETLATQAAEIYVAMETLKGLNLKQMDKLLTDLNVEVDYARVKSEKSRVAMAAKVLVEMALENFELPA